MKVKKITEVLKNFETHAEAADTFGVPKSYISRWIKYGVIIVDGKPYKPVKI